MRRAVLLSLLLQGLPVEADLPPATFHAGPQPLVAWIQTDPWAMVLGADTPALALYEDGTLICREARQGATPEYLVSTLTPARLEEIRQHVLGLGSLAALKPRYSLARVTDMPTARLFLDLGQGAPVTTEVYGLVARDDRAPASSTKPDPDSPPVSVLLLHEYLAGLRCEGGTTWTPAYVEVLLWPYEYAPDESIDWPRHWPGLTSPNAVARGDAYSIYLPGTSLKELGQLLASLKPKGALKVDGRKWAVSYRYVFPSEPVWSKAFKPRVVE